MVFPHNSYEAQHTTGLKIPLIAYLRALTAKRWMITGEVTLSYQADPEDEVSFAYEDAELKYSHLRADRVWIDGTTGTSKDDMIDGNVWTWPEDGDPLPWQLYGGAIPTDLKDSVLNRIWIGNLQQTVDGVVVNSDAYESFLLPMGANHRPTDDDSYKIGLYNGLDCSDLSQEIIVNLTTTFISGVWQYWSPGDFVDLRSMLSTAEGIEEFIEEGVTEGTIEWQTVTIAQLDIGGEKYPITRKQALITPEPPVGEEEASEGFGYVFKESTLIITAYWD